MLKEIREGVTAIIESCISNQALAATTIVKLECDFVCTVIMFAHSYG